MQDSRFAGEMQEDANSSSEVKCSYRFLKRVYSYQVVSSTFERARTLYENAKRSNALVGRACTLAEQTVVVAVEHLGVPIVTRYDEQLKRLDNVCFTQLATIEQLAESTCLRVRTQCTRLQSGYASALWAVGQVRGGLQKRADGAWEQLANENVTDRPTMLPLRLARVSFQLAQLWYHSVNAIVQKLYDASLFQAVQNSVSRFIRAVSQFDPLQSLVSATLAIMNQLKLRLSMCEISVVEVNFVRINVYYESK